MYIEECPKNVRCDTANCFSFALYNINTNGYKKNLCLCESCFNTLYSAMLKAKRKQQKNKGDK